MEQVPTYHLYNHLGAEIPFEIVDLTGKQQYDPLNFYRHSYYEIFLFEKGGGTHQIDFERFSISDQSVHVVSPGQVHMVQRALDSHGFVILFSRSFFEFNAIVKNQLQYLPYTNNNTKSPVINIPTTEFAVIQHLFNTLKTHAGGDYTDKNSMIAAYLNVLLTELKRLYLLQNPENSNPVEIDLIKQFRLLVEENFVQLHKPSDYAEKLNITTATLNEKVKKALGLTATEFIQERLILEAKRMLLFDDLNVNQIAHILGFDDPSYFTRFFKQQTQLSPAECRKQLRMEYWKEQEGA